MSLVTCLEFRIWFEFAGMLVHSPDFSPWLQDKIWEWPGTRLDTGMSLTKHCPLLLINLTTGHLNEFCTISPCRY